MSRPVTEDPNALAAIVTGMGGYVVPGPSFVFDLPLEKVRETIPRINDLAIRVRKISEYRADHPTRLNQSMSVVRLELYKSEEKPHDTPAW